MTDAPDRSFFEALIADDEFLSWLGVTLESVETGRIVLSVPADEKLTLAPSTPGMGGTTHAGILATLVDMAGEAIRTEVSSPETAVLATTDLHVSYLRPATGDLYVTGAVARVGSSMAVSDVTVESIAPDGERKEVALGRGSYRLLDADE